MERRRIQLELKARVQNAFNHLLSCASFFSSDKLTLDLEIDLLRRVVLFWFLSPIPSLFPSVPPRRRTQNNEFETHLRWFELT